MVESTALEMRHRGNSIVGSNPTLSATKSLKRAPFRGFFYALITAGARDCEQGLPPLLGHIIIAPHHAIRSQKALKMPFQGDLQLRLGLPGVEAAGYPGGTVTTHLQGFDGEIEMVPQRAQPGHGRGMALFGIVVHGPSGKVLGGEIVEAAGQAAAAGERPRQQQISRIEIGVDRTVATAAHPCRCGMA